MNIFIMSWDNIGTNNAAAHIVCKYGETYRKIRQEYPDAKITEVDETTDLSKLSDDEFYALHTKYSDAPRFRTSIRQEFKRRHVPLYKSIAPDSSSAIENALNVIRLRGCFQANNHGLSYYVMGCKRMKLDIMDMTCTLNENNDMEIEITHTNERGRELWCGKRRFRLYINNSHWKLVRIGGRGGEFPVSAPIGVEVSTFLNEVDFILCIFGTDVLAD